MCGEWMVGRVMESGEGSGFNGYWEIGGEYSVGFELNVVVVEMGSVGMKEGDEYSVGFKLKVMGMKMGSVGMKMWTWW